MANSTKNSPAASDKRERLVTSASGLMHRQGVEATTLAEIAAAADVPLGNVYYYFKTRDELVQAVIESYGAKVDGLLERLNGRAGPRARLQGLADSWGEVAELAAANGCPIGTLTTELCKSSGGLDRKAARLFERLIDWSQGQFAEAGRRDSRELAITLIGSIQGATVLANALRDPALMTAEVQRLDRWIVSLT